MFTKPSTPETMAETRKSTSASRTIWLGAFLVSAICSTLLRLFLRGLFGGLGGLHVLGGNAELPRPRQLVNAPGAAVHDEDGVADALGVGAEVADEHGQH